MDTAATSLGVSASPVREAGSPLRRLVLESNEVRDLSSASAGLPRAAGSLDERKPTEVPRHALLASAQALFELSKPRVTALVIMTTCVGAVLAPGASDFEHVALLVVGTALVVAGANALNMYLERDSDAAMERTRGRPLPSGRVAPGSALLFGVFISLAGLLLLAGFVGPEPAVVAAIALGAYVLLYTPLKRRTPWAVHVGAVPGALPPVIGWVGSAHSLDAHAASLFVLLYTWQLPHFLAIAVYRLQDYRRAGLAVWPAVYGVASTRRLMVAAAAALLVASMVPFWVGLAGTVYLSVAVSLGLAYVLVAWSSPERAGTEERWARRVFLASLPHLVIVLATLLATAG